MNPAQYETRVIGGKRFSFEKNVRRRGEIKHMVYRADDGTPAYIHPRPQEPSPPRGINTRSPLVALLLAILHH